MAFVRKDQHGLYIIADGRVYRPQWTSRTLGMYGHVAYAKSPALAKNREEWRAQTKGTQHGEGEAVKARAIAGTERATINGKSGEIWLSHPTQRLHPFARPALSADYWTPALESEIARYAESTPTA